MFSLEYHQHQYHNKLFTLIENVLPSELCQTLVKRCDNQIHNNQVQLVKHEGLGTLKELDGSGKYYHHIFLGEDIRSEFPELVAAYHSLLPLIASITCTKAILSPYPDSDINIKAYPKGGGTIGWHFDTNAITVLIYLTDNKEAPLILEPPNRNPAINDLQKDSIKIYAKKGMLVLMQGRHVWHKSDATISEEKKVAVLNYYVEGDTWRPGYFDNFVYNGKDPKEQDK